MAQKTAASLSMLYRGKNNTRVSKWQMLNYDWIKSRHEQIHSNKSADIHSEPSAERTQIKPSDTEVPD